MHVPESTLRGWLKDEVKLFKCYRWNHWIVPLPVSPAADPVHHRLDWPAKSLSMLRSLDYDASC